MWWALGISLAAVYFVLAHRRFFGSEARRERVTW
jgi:hypothetical protein